MQVLPGPDAAEQTVPVFPPRGGVAFPGRPGRKAGRGQAALRASETAALEETGRNVVANFVPKLNAYRITFTFPLINAARHVCFLVNDPKKEPVVQQVLAKSGGYPSERVAPESGRLTWILGNGK